MGRPRLSLVPKATKVPSSTNSANDLEGKVMSRLDHTRLWFTLLVALSLGLTLVSGAAHAVERDGLSHVSFGRFGDWPILNDNNDYNIDVQTLSGVGNRIPYEEDMAKRIYPDRLIRSHKDFTNDWRLMFGVLEQGFTVADFRLPVPPGAENVRFDVHTESVNWVSKQFAVLRYKQDQTTPLVVDQTCGQSDRSYSLTVNLASPGTWLTTAADTIYFDSLMPPMRSGEAPRIAFDRAAVLYNSTLDLLTLGELNGRPQRCLDLRSRSCSGMNPPPPTRCSSFRLLRGSGWQRSMPSGGTRR